MLLTKLKNVITEKGLLKKGEKVLVGVSGGVDSLALLDALHQLSHKEDWQVFAAHLDHKFRGKESAEDAEYVQEFCRKRGIPCRAEARNVPQWIAENQANPQEAARQVRFSFFHEVAAQWAIPKLALAHHANDQAETILMRVLRGTGIEGIAGIPVARQEGRLTIIRPFLSFTKRELEKYCEQSGIIPRTDSSNFKRSYHRNFLRLEVIPWLEKEVNPSVQDALNQLGMIAREENDYLEQICREMLERIMKSKQENKIVIKGKLFLTSHLALQRRMIKLIFSYLVKEQGNLGFVHIDSILEWMRLGRNGTRLELPQGIDVRKEYDEVTFMTRKTQEVQADAYSYIMEVPGRTYIKEIQAWLNANIMTGKQEFIQPESEQMAVFDLAQIQGELSIRSRQPGDRITPIGMEGSKKVKDILIDQKIPRGMRDGVPIIADREGILWLPGIRRSNRALVTDDTKQQLVLQLTTD